MPVRLGVPQGVGGLTGVVQNPIYATGVGLVMFGAQSQQERGYVSQGVQDRVGLKDVFSKMKSWFQGNF